MSTARLRASAAGQAAVRRARSLPALVPPWLRAAWRLWRRDPWLWCSASAAFIVTAALLARIPFVGISLAAALTPAALAGLLLAAADLHRPGIEQTTRFLLAVARTPGKRAGVLLGRTADALLGGLRDDALVSPLIAAGLACAVLTAVVQLAVVQVAGGAALSGTSDLGVLQMLRLGAGYGLALLACLAVIMGCLHALVYFIQFDASPGEALGAAGHAVASSPRLLAAQAATLALPVLACAALFHDSPVLGLLAPAALGSVTVPLLVGATHLRCAPADP